MGIEHLWLQQQATLLCERCSGEKNVFQSGLSGPELVGKIEV